MFGPDYLPPDDAIPDLTLRMRGHLMVLLGAAKEYETNDLRSARDLLDREVLSDYTGTRVHLRRMALACLRLLAFFTPPTHHGAHESTPDYPLGVRTVDHGPPLVSGPSGSGRSRARAEGALPRHAMS
ncbi:DUF6415 family natural product biosynthesis protein [Streptomyces lavendulae]|uniref:DUF6415 family natural product biosynthesis protein n=1 Tax=Streptomyces lavendulae TaxID=1914 RepID=UPI0024A463DE|nr:hypothetical protein Slala05_81440 [Streptomyces lavendulae subsp. lavendulae]